MPPNYGLQPNRPIAYGVSNSRPSQGNWKKRLRETRKRGKIFLESLKESKQICQFKRFDPFVFLRSPIFLSEY